MFCRSCHCNEKIREAVFVDTFWAPIGVLEYVVGDICPDDVRDGFWHAFFGSNRGLDCIVAVVHFYFCLSVRFDFGLFIHACSLFELCRGLSDRIVSAVTRLVDLMLVRALSPVLMSFFMPSPGC